jgi:hypothetical protein
LRKEAPQKSASRNPKNRKKGIASAHERFLVKTMEMARKDVVQNILEATANLSQRKMKGREEGKGEKRRSARRSSFPHRP